MTQPRARAVRFDHWTHPVFAERMATAPEVEVLVQPHLRRQTRQAVQAVHSIAQTELPVSFPVSQEALAALAQEPLPQMGFQSRMK